MNHVCPGVPKGADCVIYIVESERGHEAGVEADGVRRLRHEFVGPRSRDAAESYSLACDGINDWGNFSPTKRTFPNYNVFYKIDAADEDLVRISDWVLRPTEP